MVQGLSPELKRDLILSLGTHQANRRLSPVEVAGIIDTAYRSGATFSEIAKLVDFSSTSTLREIHRLLALAPTIQHLVGWGKPNASTLPMKSAAQVARLTAPNDQMACAKAILSHKFTSEETRQLVETRIHSQGSIDDCIDTILRLRPTVERRYLFLGAVSSDKVCQQLEDLTQMERDGIFHDALSERLGSLLSWSGKLGVSRFSLCGDSSLAQTIETMEGGFEQEITLCLREFMERR